MLGRAELFRRIQSYRQINFYAGAWLLVSATHVGIRVLPLKAIKHKEMSLATCNFHCNNGNRMHRHLPRTFSCATSYCYNVELSSSFRNLASQVFMCDRAIAACHIYC